LHAFQPYAQFVVALLAHAITDATPCTLTYLFGDVSDDAGSRHVNVLYRIGFLACQ